MRSRSAWGSCGIERLGRRLQNSHTVTSDCNRVMVHLVVILFTAMPGPQPSARAAADPRTVRLALELLERTAGRRRRCPIRALVVILTAAVLVTASIPAATAQTAGTTYQPSRVMSAAKVSNVRSGPGTRYAKVGRLAVGEQVRVTGKTGSWLQARTARRTGNAVEHRVDRRSTRRRFLPLRNSSRPDCQLPAATRLSSAGRSDGSGRFHPKDLDA